MVYRLVSEPEGLRRLTSATGKFRARESAARRSSDPAGYGSMSQIGTVDLEAGTRGDDTNKRKTGMLHKAASSFSRHCRGDDGGGGGGGGGCQWKMVMILLQAVTIVGLVLRVRRDSAGAMDLMQSAVLVGPRVEFVDSEESRELTHLIMVPGHGVTMTESLEGADSRDADWFLLDYQKERDVPRALVGHIRGGLDELDADRASLLLFSGGQTRVIAGPKSEGESYFFVADHYDWWGKPDLRARALTEEYARDSFENLLFSICRFKEVTGNYPTKITIVGYDFKQDRFEDLHRAALRFPPEAFRYVGLRPGGRFDHVAAEAGERASALEPYRLDPYGCAADRPLAAKRAERDRFHRTPPYSLVCPEMRDLLAWCGPGYFTGDLPWSPVVVDEEEPGAGDRGALGMVEGGVG